jgi:sporulation protein YlmC with PRC-barrel domain
MSLKTGAGVAALALSLSFAAAMAQTTPPQQKPAPQAEAPKTPVSGQIMMQEANTVLAKDVIGQNVYTPDKTKIGSISDLILSKDGRSVEGFVIGVGGFLGIGERNVALKMDRLQITPDTESGGMRLVMDAKKEELANAPPFKSMKEQEAEKRAAERPSQPSPGGQRPTTPR